MLLNNLDIFLLIEPLAILSCKRKGPGYLSWYSDSLRAGQSGDRIPVGGEIFRTRPDRPWGRPNVLYNRYRVFPGGKAAEAWR
jgi:hypothetical protein